jgi:hypothetical protein
MGKDVYDDWILQILGHYARSKYAGEVLSATQNVTHLPRWMDDGS